MPQVGATAQTTMALTESDKVFSSVLHEIERYYMDFSKANRIRVEKWAEKLALTGHNLTWKRQRNAYAKLLLHMILNRDLSAPFSSLPPEGSLASFPAHLKAYSVRGAYDRSGSNYGMAWHSHAGQGTGAANYVAGTIINAHSRHRKGPRYSGKKPAGHGAANYVPGAYGGAQHSTLFWRDVYEAVRESPLGETLAQEEVVINHIYHTHPAPAPVPHSVPASTPAPVPEMSPVPELPAPPLAPPSFEGPTVASLLKAAAVDEAAGHLLEVDSLERHREQYADKHNPHQYSPGHERRGPQTFNRSRSPSPVRGGTGGGASSSGSSSSISRGNYSTSLSPSRKLPGSPTSSPQKMGRAADGRYSQQQLQGGAAPAPAQVQAQASAGTSAALRAANIALKQADKPPSLPQLGEQQQQALAEAASYVISHGGGVTKFHYNADEDGKAFMTDAADANQEIRRLALLARGQQHSMDSLKEQLRAEKDSTAARLQQQAREHVQDLREVLTGTCTKCAHTLSGCDDNDSLDGHPEQHTAKPRRVSFGGEQPEPEPQSEPQSEHARGWQHTSAHTSASREKYLAPSARAPLSPRRGKKQQPMRSALRVDPQPAGASWQYKGQSVGTDTELEGPQAPLARDRISDAWQALLQMDHEPARGPACNFPAPYRGRDRYNGKVHWEAAASATATATATAENKENSNTTAQASPAVSAGAPSPPSLEQEQKKGKDQGQRQVVQDHSPHCTQPAQAFSFLERDLDRQHWEQRHGTVGSMFRPGVGVRTSTLRRF